MPVSLSLKSKLTFFFIYKQYNLVICYYKPSSPTSNLIPAFLVYNTSDNQINNSRVLAQSLHTVLLQ